MLITSENQNSSSCRFQSGHVYKGDNSWALTMEGRDEYIKIWASCSLKSGETMSKSTVNDKNVDDSPWIHPVIVIALFLVNFYVLALMIMESPNARMYFRRLLLRTEPTYVKRRRSMSRRLVKALPCVVYNPLEDPKSINTTCVVCQEDFTRGARLRVLPCNHRFHKKCIDKWLTMRRAFCPICKHDAREKNAESILPMAVSNHAPINCTSITN